MRRTWMFLTVCAICLALTAVPGCSAQQVARIKLQVAKAQEFVGVRQASVNALKAEQAKFAKLIDDLPPGEDREWAKRMKARADGMLAQATGVLEMAERTLDELEIDLAEAEDGLGVLMAFTETTAKTLPPPYSTWAIVGVGALGWIRAAWNRHLGRKSSKTVDPYLAKAIGSDDQAKEDLRRAQGPSVRRLVDEAQGRKRIRPF